MQIHAGIEMGGSIVRSGPHSACSRSFVSVGMSSAKRSNSSSGVPQSRPISARRLTLVIIRLHSVDELVGRALVQLGLPVLQALADPGELAVASRTPPPGTLPGSFSRC